MKQIQKVLMVWHIARTELRILFYSPVAWLVLIVVAVQAGFWFTGAMRGPVEAQELGGGITNLSELFFGRHGLFRTVQGYLYIYIPLLTMGLLSRELNSGSIKLLYTAPVNNTQIILGKYVAMVIFNLLLIAILALFVILGACTVENFEIAVALGGLLGIYLLACTYAAVGLFMSGITSYQIVSVLGTIILLGLLQSAWLWWQDIPFLRDLTYWLGMSSRTEKFYLGLLTSTDILYFCIIPILFLSLTIMRLKVIRQKMFWMQAWGRYIAIVVLAVFVGYLTTLPYLKTCVDVTSTEKNTLTPPSRDIMDRLDGKLKITSYLNIIGKGDHMALPEGINFDKTRFSMYTRYKPNIEFDYVYYYDGEGLSFEAAHEKMLQACRYRRLDTSLFLPPTEIRKQIDLSGEGYQFVRVLETANGQKTFLRIFDDNHGLPTEGEISAALKRLVEEPWKIGLVENKKGRSREMKNDLGYSRLFKDQWFRYGLCNNGFEVFPVSLAEKLPEELDILVLADLRDDFTEDELNSLKSFIDAGKNLLICTDVKSATVMQPLLSMLGVKIVDGQLVKKSDTTTPDWIYPQMTAESQTMASGFWRRGMYVAMLGCCGLDYQDCKDYVVTPLTIVEGAWNEKETVNFVDDTVKVNDSKGEILGRYATSLALSRKVGTKEQRIVLVGDADYMDNGEIECWHKTYFTRNLSYTRGIFYWLSEAHGPIDIQRPASHDNKMKISLQEMEWVEFGFKYVLGGILLLVAVIVLMRRKGK